MGQHFLEPVWADKVVEAINPAAGDRFLEIGPGHGILTLRLAPRVRELTAVEIDRDLADRLAPSLPANATLVRADFLDFDLRPLVARGSLRVAGNLPYYVSSPILFKLLAAHRAHGGLVDATLMLQREVADRLTAPVGTAEYGVLAILVQWRADVERVLALPPGAFRPAPKVRSAVVRLRFRPSRVSVRDEAFLERLVRTLFTQRRKTVLNALRPLALERHADAAALLRLASIDAVRRPETLQLSEFARLADEFGRFPTAVL